MKLEAHESCLGEHQHTALKDQAPFPLITRSIFKFFPWAFPGDHREKHQRGYLPETSGKIQR